MNMLVSGAAMVPPAIALSACYERRRFWRHENYHLINRSLLFIGLGFLLLIPSLNSIGDGIFAVVGIANLEDITGITLFLVGAQHLTLHLLFVNRRLTGLLARQLSLATTIVVVLVWILFLLGPMSHVTGSTIHTQQTGILWGVVGLWCSILFTALGLSALRMINCTIGLTRKISVFYLLAALFGLASCVHRIYEVTVVDSGPLPAHMLITDYSLRAAMLIGLAIAGHMSFKRLTKPLVIPDVWPPRDNHWDRKSNA